MIILLTKCEKQVVFFVKNLTEFGRGANSEFDCFANLILTEFDAEAI